MQAQKNRVVLLLTISTFLVGKIQSFWPSVGLHLNGYRGTLTTLPERHVSRRRWHAHHEFVSRSTAVSSTCEQKPIDA
jgi:hypothetical protein